MKFHIFSLGFAFMFVSEGVANPNSQTSPLSIPEDAHFRFGVDKTLVLKLRELRSRGEQVDVLIRFFNTKQVSTAERVYILSLLTQAKTKTAIDMMIENIDFHWKGEPSRPALSGIIDIGEPATSSLLRHLEIETKEEKKFLIVRALMNIKGDKYPEYVSKHFSTWSVQIREAVSIYTMY